MDVPILLLRGLAASWVRIQLILGLESISWLKA